MKQFWIWPAWILHHFDKVDTLLAKAYQYPCFEHGFFKSVSTLLKWWNFSIFSIILFMNLNLVPAFINGMLYCISECLYYNHLLLRSIKQVKDVVEVHMSRLLAAYGCWYCMLSVTYLCITPTNFLCCKCMWII
jgi:hypothetical protein